MSDETIRKNDLVMIVRPTICCGSSKSIGLIRTVAAHDGMEYVYCGMCGFRQKKHRNYAHFTSGGCCELSRLKKINPPPLSEETETRQEIEA